MLAIKAENLTKIYKLYNAPQDRLKELFLRRPYHQAFKALDNFSIEVLKGQTLGIIGDNGAGKSTFLKLLAGTLAPTSGNLSINGRVAALLELGAGFHPDFSGRQNIFLNGALLGLSDREIAEKQDEIIAFAELENFIEQPIKTYSSGMYVRLAFSIATSVDPDILIIDEALSVGDRKFQKKCIDRMIEFKESGKTIIFCSHSMYHVNQLCEHAVWIQNGRLLKQGKAVQITADYEDYCTERNTATTEEETVVEERTEYAIRIKKIIINGTEDELMVETGDNLDIAIEYESYTDDPFIFAIGIKRNDELIVNAISMAYDQLPPLTHRGKGTVTSKYANIPLLHGSYYAVAMVLDEHGLHLYDQKTSSRISIKPHSEWKPELGLIRIDHDWHF